MQELVRWYWEHGVKRGHDANDPDSALHKISIGSWLDPIVRIIDRNEAIQSNANSKACLALWGPSQTGKSTMMSRYIDGIQVDGSDSALTWSDAHKTRFSPPVEGIASLEGTAGGTLVFNPYNHQSDASGVATRYTLQRAADNIVNQDFPIAIKFTNRAQIIQSLALGYLSECEPKGEVIVFTQDAFMGKISDVQGQGDVSEDAYWLLKDIANVIEFMRGIERFSNLFRSGDWFKKVRKALVESPALLSSVKAVEKFMADIFWDGDSKLTNFYKEAERMLNVLSAEWRDCKVFVTMEVGALLLDIDSFKSYDSPDSEQAERVRKMVSALAYERSGDEIHIFLQPGGSKIAGDEFGYFQAICAELKVPLKQENLEVDSRKNAFVELVKKCDILDFPGVSNKNAGNVIGVEDTAKIDLTKARPAEIFTKVFKQGKTQCFVYSYVKKYGIDAFSILVRTDRPVSQSSLLNAGIREWVCSFEPNWTPSRRTEMPIFINMTFFASLLNSVGLNGVGNGLGPYVERIQELTFAKKESAKFFVTTYQQFHEGKIDNECQRDNTIAAIMKDPAFTEFTGLTEDGIRAVYSPDGGLDYMFTNIGQRINSSRRLERCRLILEEDERELRRLIQNQLPSGADARSDERKQRLRDCQDTIGKLLSKIEADDNATEYRRVATYLKGLFSASYTIFEPLPVRAEDMSKREISIYIKEQIGKWYSYEVANLDDSEYISSEEKQAILMALRDSINVDSLFRLIKENFGQLDGRGKAEAARYPFALAFGNLLQKGCINVENDVEVGDRNPELLDTFIKATIDKDSSREGSPYHHTILAPFISRLGELSENCIAGARPPQAGDAELKAIFDKIESSQLFQIH